MQHFDCLQLEFFHKQIWGCYTGSCTAEAKINFLWLLWEPSRSCYNSCSAGQTGLSRRVEIGKVTGIK